MTKSKKLLVLLLALTFTVSVLCGTMIAFADEATKDHEFDAKNDVVFEDFDRADIADTVKVSATGVNLGEKPYLHVEFAALTAESGAADRVSQIYKQGSGALAGATTSSLVVYITMRAPAGGLALSDLYFATRGAGHNGDDIVFAKLFSELKDTDGEALPALSAEWQTYEISFATSYEDTDKYEGVDVVTATPVEGLHIYAKDGVAGKIDIQSISYSATAINLNNFTGGDKVEDTAKAADTGHYWSGSSTGVIVKRLPVLTAGGELSVVKSDAVSDKYSYAIIEAEGDVANLKVATTTDGEAWGEAAVLVGNSVAISGAEKGFKFIYDGSAEGGVTLKRIYLTSLVLVPDAKVVPLFDAQTVQLLEDFAVAQSGFTGDWDSMSTAPQLEPANLEYRLSYSNGDKVEIKDGCLVFAPQDGYTNFKFKSKTPAEGSLIVLKLKLEGEGDLGALRFATIAGNDAASDVRWPHEWKAGHNLAAKVLDTPYQADGWKYVVIDLEESALTNAGGNYAGLDMYYGGAGTLYIDEIFFADAAAFPVVEKSFTTDTKINFVPTDEGYQYAGYLYVPSNGYGTTIEMDIISAADNFDISGIRFGMAGGVYWASANAEGTLKTTDGKTLAELTYKNGTATHVVIDLAASGIEGEFADVHVHSNGTGTGAFKIENVTIKTATPCTELRDLDKDHSVTVESKADFAATSTDGYQWAGQIEGLNDLDGGVLAFDITPTAEGFDVSGIRLGMTAGGVYWASENAEGTLKTTDGKTLAELTYEKDKATHVEIDLAASGIAAVSNFHIHTNGTATGSFKLESVTVIPYVDYLAPAYSEATETLPLYTDKVDPVVSISTATTATAGDVVEVKYTVNDDIASNSLLTIAVSVTKDNVAVALDANKFTASEGTYKVTVTATDVAGNVGSATIQITVSPKADEPVDPPADGLPVGAIIGIVVGVVAVVAAAVVAVILIRKKNANK